MLQRVFESDHPVHGHTPPVVLFSAVLTELRCQPKQLDARMNSPAKKDFLTFPRYSSYSMWVRLANLQPSNVKFLQDSVCQK